MVWGIMRKMDCSLIIISVGNGGDLKEGHQTIHIHVLLIAPL